MLSTFGSGKGGNFPSLIFFADAVAPERFSAHRVKFDVAKQDLVEVYVVLFPFFSPPVLLILLL